MMTIIEDVGSSSSCSAADEDAEREISHHQFEILVNSRDRCAISGQ